MIDLQNRSMTIHANVLSYKPSTQFSSWVRWEDLPSPNLNNNATAVIPSTTTSIQFMNAVAGIKLMATDRLGQLRSGNALFGGTVLKHNVFSTYHDESTKVITGNQNRFVVASPLRSYFLSKRFSLGDESMVKNIRKGIVNAYVKLSDRDGLYQIGNKMVNWRNGFITIGSQIVSNLPFTTFIAIRSSPKYLRDIGLNSNMIVTKRAFQEQDKSQHNTNIMELQPHDTNSIQGYVYDPNTITATPIAPMVDDRSRKGVFIELEILTHGYTRLNYYVIYVKPVHPYLT